MTKSLTAGVANCLYLYSQGPAEFEGRDLQPAPVLTPDWRPLPVVPGSPVAGAGLVTAGCRGWHYWHIDGGNEI